MSKRFRSPFFALLCGAVFGGSALLCGAQDSGFSMDLHANSHATAKDIGLPVYPGAVPAKEGDDNSSANLGFAMNGFGFKLLAASYLTADSPARVLDYYRKPLSKYGEVLECANGKPVGSLTVTRSGLTCSSKGNGNLEVNGSSSSTDHELRAGAPLRFRIVGIDTNDQGKTKFGLVYLELPKDSDSKKD